MASFLFGIGILLLIIPIFIAPPQGVSCGLNVICYYQGMTDFGLLATFAGIALFAISIAIMIRDGTATKR